MSWSSNELHKALQDKIGTVDFEQCKIICPKCSKKNKETFKLPQGSIKHVDCPSKVKSTNTIFAWIYVEKLNKWFSSNSNNRVLRKRKKKKKKKKKRRKSYSDEDEDEDEETEKVILIEDEDNEIKRMILSKINLIGNTLKTFETDINKDMYGSVYRKCLALADDKKGKELFVKFSGLVSKLKTIEPKIKQIVDFDDRKYPLLLPFFTPNLIPEDVAKLNQEINSLKKQIEQQKEEVNKKKRKRDENDENQNIQPNKKRKI